MSRIAKSIRSMRSKNAKKTPKDPKIARKVIPLMERERIAQMHLLGKNKSEIAAETGHTRKSISKIISEADIPAFVEKVRGQFVGLGTLAVITLEKRMRAGDYELAYKFLKDTGIIADVESRSLAMGIATGKPTQVTLSAESRDLLLRSLSDADRHVFRVLQTFREKTIAYGLGPNIDLPEQRNPANPSEMPSVPAKGA